jgi:hypothetical protein
METCACIYFCLHLYSFFYSYTYVYFHFERSERVRHVYVHAGGKIEALGTNPDRLGVTGGTGIGVTTDLVNTAVETVCVVDVRDNTPSETSQAFELMTMERNFNTGLHLCIFTFIHTR